MQVLGKAVLIKPDQPPERTQSGRLIIPKDVVAEKPKTGTVEDCGPECEFVIKGSRVIFPRKNASVIVIDDVDFYFITEDRLTYVAGEGEKI